jgi:hypothetical protein
MCIINHITSHSFFFDLPKIRNNNGETAQRIDNLHTSVSPYATNIHAEAAVHPATVIALPIHDFSAT